MTRRSRFGLSAFVAGVALAVMAPAALAATTINSGPSGPWNSTDATFGWTPATGSFTCTLDGSGSSCTSPQTYHGLSEGPHTFHVQSVGGGVDPGDSRSFTVDVTPPDTNVTSSPPNGQSGTTASWGFDSNDGSATFQCSLDGGAFTTCTSPKNFASLAQGLHVLQVRARDQAGNNDPSPALGFWTADATAPDTTITQSPPQFDSNASPDIEFASSEAGSTFLCSLDGATATACSSPDHLSGLGDGQHTISVQAVDGFGNVDPSAATATWHVDLTPPDTVLTAKPPLQTNDTSAKFGFDTSEPQATYQCSLDGADFAACSNGQAYTQLTEGEHDFRVRSVDAHGSADPTPAQHRWVIDRTAPPAPTFSLKSVPNQVLGTQTAPRVHDAAVQTAQPNSPTVPFGAGAALTKAAPMFSLGQTFAVSWGVPPASEPVTYDVTIDSEDMIQGMINLTGKVFGNLVPPHSAQTAVLLPAGAGKTFCFNGRAVDQAFNDSPWGGAVCTTTPRPAKDLDKSGKWTKKTVATEFGGGHLEATAGSLSLSEHRAYTPGGYWHPEAGGIFVGHVALVATRCKGCGTVRVTYRSSGVKGTVKKVKAISLNAASNKPDQIIPVVSFPSKKTDFNENVEVTIEVTSHRKLVRIEGLGVSAF